MKPDYHSLSQPQRKFFRNAGMKQVNGFIHAPQKLHVKQFERQERNQPIVLICEHIFLPWCEGGETALGLRKQVFVSILQPVLHIRGLNPPQGEMIPSRGDHTR